MLTCGPPSISATVPKGKDGDYESCSDDDIAEDDENQTVCSLAAYSHSMTFFWYIWISYGLDLKMTVKCINRIVGPYGSTKEKAENHEERQRKRVGTEEEGTDEKKRKHCASWLEIHSSKTQGSLLNIAFFILFLWDYLGYYIKSFKNYWALIEFCLSVFKFNHIYLCILWMHWRQSEIL